MSDNDADGIGEVTEVIVVGDLDRTHGYFTDCSAARTAASTRFDSAADTWTVTTGDGRTLTGRVLIDTRPGGGDVVAVHGIPNRFRISGPHTRCQARYVARIVAGLRRSGSTRIEAHSRVRVHRLLPTRGVSRFYLDGSVGATGPADEIYDGPAVLTHAGRDHPTRVRLAGHFDPIDGQYHWQGTVYADLLSAKVTGFQVSIRIGEHTAAGRISERTPGGTLSVVGADGYPPFQLEDVEIDMPPRV